MIRFAGNPASAVRNSPAPENVAGTAFSGKPIAETFIPPMRPGVGEKETAAAADFAATPVRTNEHERFRQFELTAAAHGCKVLKVIDQGNPLFNDARLPSANGRCRAISQVHAYSQLHGRPEIWNAYTNPVDRQLGFAMLQRAQPHYEKFDKQRLKDKQRQLARENPTWRNSARRLVGRPADLTADQQPRLNEFINEQFVRLALSFVPGAQDVKLNRLGGQLNIAQMVGDLPAGVHLLTIIVPGADSHQLSCNISGSVDIPSRLMDPNFCEWSGDQKDLGNILKAHWEDSNLINRWCQNGSWVRLTYR